MTKEKREEKQDIEKEKREEKQDMSDQRFDGHILKWNWPQNRSRLRAPRLLHERNTSLKNPSAHLCGPGASDAADANAAVRSPGGVDSQQVYTWGGVSIFKTHTQSHTFV